MAEHQDECFVVGVIGKSGSEQRIHADWFFEGIVRPLFAEHYPNFRVLRADHMKMPGIITSQIIEKLLNVRLVIADLTFLNPNAFYEIGIRHMTGKAVVHVHRAGEAIPFDISTFLSMEYSVVQHSEMVAARENLKALVDNVLAPGHKMENPVTQAQGRAQFEVTATAPDRVLLSQIEALSARLSVVEHADPDVWYLNGEKMAARMVRSPKKLREPTTGRFYGGGAAVPNNQITFTPKPGTKQEVLDQFIDGFLGPYQSGNVVIAKREEGYTVNYNDDAIDREILDQWAKVAGELGIYAIPF
jgi:hypothetical protein